MNLKIDNWIIGSDPEVFLQNRVTKDVVSAIPFVPGDKHNPYQIPELSEGHMIQTDNIMVEYCLPPTSDWKILKESFERCVRYTNKTIPGELEVIVKASARVRTQYLQDEQAKKFGCDPDYNAWTDRLNEAPDSKTNLRTCGGHIHIGYDNPDMEISIKLVKALDIFLGVPSILLDPDKERKKMYGKAGAYRLKPYGVEYRGLSNYWLAEDDSLKLIFNGVRMAVAMMNSSDSYLDRMSDEMQLKIQTCINTGDEKLAHELIPQLNLASLLAKSAVYVD